MVDFVLKLGNSNLTIEYVKKKSWKNIWISPHKEVVKAKSSKEK